MTSKKRGEITWLGRWPSSPQVRLFAVPGGHCCWGDQLAWLSLAFELCLEFQRLLPSKVRQLEPVMREIRRVELVIRDGSYCPALLDGMLYSGSEAWKPQRLRKAGPEEVGARDVQLARDAWADVEEVGEFSGGAHNSNCIGPDRGLLKVSGCSFPASPPWAGAPSPLWHVSRCSSPLCGPHRTHPRALARQRRGKRGEITQPRIPWSHCLSTA
jgi:hypothetical protein